MLQQSSRRVRAHLSEFNTNQMHLRNPYVIAFWSMMTPGLGNLLQSRLAKGLVLVIWGLFVNTAAKINLAVVYSLTGQFDLAKSVLDTRWLLLFIAVYVYGVWDAYRGTVDLNQLYLLADREDAQLTAFTIKTLDLNYLDKRSPWVAAVWSALMPGLGAFYLQKVMEGFFFVGWGIFVLYQSHGLQAIHLSLTGQFEQAKAVLNVQWFLYLPAIYFFQVYHSFVATVESNKLFEKEQSQFLRENYQQPDFKMPM